MTRTQADHERAILHRGIERVRDKIADNEQKGRAHNNAYAQPIYRRWVIPLREMIQETLEEGLKKSGRRAAHIALLKPLDPSVVAFCAVRVVIVNAMQGGDDGMDARRLASAIGAVLHQEMILSVFEDISPDLFYEVTNDLDRRRSQSSTHRFNALMGSARNNGLEFPRWRQEEREQLGMWVLEALRVLGMVDVLREKQAKLGRIKEHLAVFLSDPAHELIERVKGLVEINRPWHLPCIEQPKDWVSFNEGGWHSPEMRRSMPFCVNIRRVRNTDLLDRVKKADLSRILPAINHLQAVRWAVNKEMLETIREVARSPLDLKEALSEKGPDAPERPPWLNADGKTKGEMNEDQEAEFKQWKRAMAQYYTDRKLRGQRWGRLSSALRTAAEYKDYEAIYFVYQADFRGRLYAQTTGISPQGSDLQKALLHFADGKPLDTPQAIRWFKINGANRFGVDKRSLDDRAAWVDAEHEHILAFASDPIGNRGWTLADKPLQFLAWAKEYAAWIRNPGAFLSRIPVGLDGSCNGLQHFSAMLRDQVGGKATNLLPAPQPNDIYAQVALVTQEKLTDLNPESLGARDQEYRKLWIRHGINRKLVKRSVMTLPYGSTRYSCADFIVKDYLRKGEAEEFEPTQYASAANFLSHLVWESIGEVVVAASSAMSWLQRCARGIIKDGHSQIEWVAPSGFPVTQVYNKREEIRINAKLFGGCRLWVHKDVDEPKSSGHKNGLAPNFVHSMDAAHLTLTTLACQEVGINSLAMIHDDYGTHAADTQRLYEIIRRTFVEIYERNDPIQDFYQRYPGLPEAPPRGGLDLQQVLRSEFFFA
ncbi:DNA-directed RNA polymerase [Bordetella bronchiseptica]|uniref:DNA-directed RNA polymerase n=1 Tax=Bordetella bronchiseptica TaxID=518 RepID=UPI000461CE2A|nr:DNA-directed RNA polymerase [Bordetella bronchiseptica]KDD18643.1 DNA-directed RNA polymerase [Bordetella bronchiseptica MBORD707]